MKKILAAVGAALGLSLAVVAPVSAASPTGTVSYTWNNVSIPGETETYTIVGGYSTTKSGKTTTSHTSCYYSVPVNDGRFGYETRGSYVVPGIQATTESDLQAFCVEHFADRTL